MAQGPDYGEAKYGLHADLLVGLMISIVIGGAGACRLLALIGLRAIVDRVRIHPAIHALGIYVGDCRIDDAVHCNLNFDAQ
jgi:hypothetical protein